MTPQSARWRPWALTAFVCSLTLAACAGPPVPTAEMRAAADAIGRAHADGAERLSPQALQTAEAKLANARASVQSDKNEQARMLAEQARADADFADANSNAQRVGATAQELMGAQQQHLNPNQ